MEVSEMSKRTARSYVLDKPKGNFILDKYEIPDPAPGSVLMRIELCGVCGTDVHTWQSEVEEMEYPISLGHEIVGKVEALGDGVSTDYIGKPLKVGDRIGVIPAIHCHKCYFCTIVKTPEKCVDWKTYGTWPNADKKPYFTGGYGDYLYIHDPNSVFVKVDTTARRGAFLEPMAVVVHSMLHARIEPGDTVVVNGAGPIGLLTVGLAKISGASKVIAIGRKNRMRLKLAEKMGADVTVCHVDIPVQRERTEFMFQNSLSGYGADVVFNTVGSAQAFAQSIDYVRDSGTLVEVGNFVDSGTIEFNPCKQLLERGIRIIGSFDNEAAHFVKSLPIIADERLPIPDLITHEVPLERLQECLSAIRDGTTMDGKQIVKIMIDPSM
jgi:threonine dehydrogenase-like Zn-dependent dehydrogenase